jgi:flagellar basal-body rod protein FlgF
MDLMTIASIAMQNDQVRMESISHNIANVLTPGYKRQVPVTTFEQQLAAAVGARASPGPALRVGASTLAIDASAGPLRHTGSGQDVTIEGAGFFEVETVEGRAFTRRGDLHADRQGRLVGGHDFPVLGVGGEIRLANAPFNVASNGDVEQDGNVVGRLRQVRFDQASALLPAGNGLYRQGGARISDAPGTDTLRPGFLESANVSSPQEMVRLTETVRHYEALAKIVQGYDQSLEQAIRKLGEF